VGRLKSASYPNGAREIIDYNVTGRLRQVSSEDETGVSCGYEGLLRPRHMGWVGHIWARRQGYMFVTEAVKEALEEAQVTGIRLRRLTEAVRLFWDTFQDC